MQTVLRILRVKGRRRNTERRGGSYLAVLPAKLI